MFFQKYRSLSDRAQIDTDAGLFFEREIMVNDHVTSYEIGDNYAKLGSESA